MPNTRLAIFGSSPCGQCHAACCKQNGHEFAVLLRGDEITRFKPWATGRLFQSGERSNVEMVLPYRDGRCVFLGDDDRCMIYDDRPQSCREFECTPKFNQHGIDEHGEFLVRNPRVLALLQAM